MIDVLDLLANIRLCLGRDETLYRATRQRIGSPEIA